MSKNKEHARHTVSLVYQCRLSLSTRTVNHLADLLRRHLKSIGSRWRTRTPGKIAVIVLAVLRHDQRLADIAGGNDISATTVRRWRDEMIALLAPQAPRLDRALKKIAKRSREAVLVDCTLIPTQRRTGTANRPNYSGKHHHHGLHFLALTDERGHLIWISAARPGRTHDITAARRDHLLTRLRAASLGALADLGFLGLDDDPDDPVVVTGFKATRARKLTTCEKEANRVLASARVPVEHGFAHLWRGAIRSPASAGPPGASTGRIGRCSGRLRSEEVGCRLPEGGERFLPSVQSRGDQRGEGLPPPREFVLLLRRPERQSVLEPWRDPVG